MPPPMNTVIEAKIWEELLHIKHRWSRVLGPRDTERVWRVNTWEKIRNTLLSQRDQPMPRKRY